MIGNMVLLTKAGIYRTLQFKTLKFTPASGVVLAPQYVGGDVHLKKANSWTGSDTVRMVTPDCVDAVKISVEPRTYVQNVSFSGIGACSVEPARR